MGGPDDLRIVRAPGRVNLMGDHTDYQEGFCLPVAIDRYVYVACRPHRSQTIAHYNESFVLPVAIDRECVAAVLPRSDGRVVARSLDMEGVLDVAADGSDHPDTVDPPWGRVVAAVVAALATRGRDPVGADVAVSSAVPVGSGLSSSAAFEVAVALALCDAASFELDPVHVALACREAEHRATGVPCGVMDQLASACGVTGHALLVDCRSLGVLPIPLPPDLAILVVHSGESRALTNTPYAQRRAACEQTARRFGVATLRDAAAEQVADEPLARHVVTENARVAATALALAAGDVDALADAFAASHASLRDDFACSTPELDDLVDGLVAAGATGARLTGAGWGGCAVALVPHDRLEAVRASAGDREQWVCRAVDGAGPMEA